MKTVEVRIFDLLTSISHLEVEIAECPFCKNDSQFTVYCSGKQKESEVVCSICGSKGPTNYSHRGAINLWNKR